MNIKSDNNISLNLLEIIDKLNFENKASREFFKRIYTTPLDVYKERLHLLNFEKHKTVLDAGCGFGQWTMALSELNANVYAIEADFSRMMITKTVSEVRKRKNIIFNLASTEKLPFLDDSFDAIFSYSVLYSTDFKKTIKEFYRVLKPKGSVYIVTNEFGWYLKRIITNYNSTPDYNSRKEAIKTIFSSIKFALTNKHQSGTDVITTIGKINSTLKLTGFKNIICKPEGNIQLNSNVKKRPFYSPKYLGFPTIFEVMAEK